MEIYPSADIALKDGIGALITAVAPGSPADDAGFTPGCIITTINGRPLADQLLWQWESADWCITLGYIDTDGDEGEVELERDIEEPWGFTFDGSIFDGVHLCRNACTFCFMRQLPGDMRSSLTLRDDDYRLSFLQGTFVTLTNIKPEDEARIIEERISPLRVSLHAYDAETRRRMIGKHAAHGLEVLKRLLAAGIECYTQIVLVPGQNDGEVLRETIQWAYDHPGILELGIVPLGFTDYQKTFHASFNAPESAASVLQIVEPFQARALEERGYSWVYCADEFYCNAYGADTPHNLPQQTFYGDCSMYEDGIGIVRTYLDSWQAACENGTASALANALEGADVKPVLVFGCSVEDFAPQVLAASPLAGKVDQLFVRNAFFGGNVDVTGLLCGCDICAAAADYASREPGAVFYLPEIIFNDDHLTLDGMTLEMMETQAGVPFRVVSCSPQIFMTQIAEDLS